MLSEMRRIGGSVVLPALVPDWRDFGRCIVDVLVPFNNGDKDYRKIRSFQSHEKFNIMRREIFERAPVLLDFSNYLKGELIKSGCAVYVPDMGLRDFCVNDRALMVYALSCFLGEPSPTDFLTKRIVWDVAPREVEKGYFSKFSEHAGEAGYHTDTQYYPSPEKSFILYTISAAKCGGAFQGLAMVGG